MGISLIGREGGGRVSDATFRGLMGLIKGHNDIDMTVTARRNRERERETYPSSSPRPPLCLPGAVHMLSPFS